MSICTAKLVIFISNLVYITDNISITCTFVEDIDTLRILSMMKLVSLTHNIQAFVNII